jgi:small nuclear ribonucleoprotein (snRNP)-like protein
MEGGYARLLRLLNQKVEVRITDTRMFYGVLIGFDKHTNIVLKDSEERRIIDNQVFCEPKGLIVLRGGHVMTIGADTVCLQDSIGKKASLFQTGIGTVSPYSDDPGRLV